MTHFLSAAILMVLLFGRTLPGKNTRLHVYTMAFVIVSDTLLVLYLALARHVLDKINPQMPTLLMVHIALALSTVGCYYYTAYIGWKLYHGQDSYRARMRTMDRVIVPLRIAVFATSLTLKLLG